MIKLIEISKIYRTSEIETMALDNINLEVRDGEFVSIMGPSGCGKSTLLNIAGLLDEPSSGTVELHGKAVSGLNAREAARFRNTELGFVFQSFHLIPSLNVLDNVQMPLLYRKMGATERKERALRMIDAVGLNHRIKHFPSQLSGGQCQRVAIARALVGDPSIILAHGAPARGQQAARQDHPDGDPQRVPGQADRPHHPHARRPHHRVGT